MFDGIIVFADLVNSSRFAEALPRGDYYSILRCFGKLGARLRKRYLESDASVAVRGEELEIIIPVSKRPRGAARDAVQLAYEIKAAWASIDANDRRIREGASPIDVAVGIHFGQVAPLKGTDARTTNTGSSLNFAKRVEDLARHSRGTGIAVSQSFVNICRAAGVPIDVGTELIHEIQGFASPEPVFGLRSQYCTTLHDLGLGADVLDRLVGRRAFDKTPWYGMFKRDPIRSRWFVEMLIDSLFFAGQYESVLEHIAPLVLKYDQSPSLLYRVARCYHRADWSLGKRCPLSERAATAHAIDLYRASGRHFIWGKLDHAAALWKRAVQFAAGFNPTPPNAPSSMGHTREDAYVHSLECRDAISLCDDVIAAEPLHFSAYNLRALCIAEYLLLRSILHPTPSRGYVHRGELKTLSARAYDDLELARIRNPAPKYLYLGTEAAVTLATLVAGLVVDPSARRASASLALKRLVAAEASATKRALAAHPDQLEAEDYWQDGFAVPSAAPPRIAQLRNRWRVLKAQIEGHSK